MHPRIATSSPPPAAYRRRPHHRTTSTLHLNDRKTALLIRCHDPQPLHSVQQRREPCTVAHHRRQCTVGRRPPSSQWLTADRLPQAIVETVSRLPPLSSPSSAVARHPPQVDTRYPTSSSLSAVAWRRHRRPPQAVTTCSLSSPSAAVTRCCYSRSPFVVGRRTPLSGPPNSSRRHVSAVTNILCSRPPLEP